MFLEKDDRRRILGHPAVYSAFTFAIGGRESRRMIVEDYVWESVARRHRPAGRPAWRGERSLMEEGNSPG